MLNKSISRVKTWLDIDDSVESRKKYGFELEIGEQLQKKIEIKMKKPGAFNYQGKVRLLRIEKKEDRKAVLTATQILATLEYNCNENKQLKEAEEGRAIEDLKILMQRYDNAISRGWMSTLSTIQDEISQFIEGLEKNLAPENSKQFTLIQVLPEKYDWKKSQFETVSKGSSVFSVKKTIAGKEQTVQWNAVYHYELIHPKRKQPKTFITVQDIFASAEHTLYDHTQRGRKAKAKLYNVFAAFLWTILTATTEIITLTGGSVVKSTGFSTWMVAVGEAVFFVFLLYIVVRAIMSGIPVFTIELKPITYSATAEGPVPAIVDDEKLLDTLLEMASASKGNIIDMGETLYSFQQGIIAENESKVAELEARNNILELKMKESQEDSSYLSESGRIRIRKVTPRWAYATLIVAIGALISLAYVTVLVGA